MLKNNILKVDSAESVIDFVKSVEYDNSEKLSEVVKSNVEILFDIDSTLRKIKKISDSAEVDEDVDVVKDLVLELHLKLLNLDMQNHHHLKIVDEIFTDSRLIYHVIKENKELIL